MSKLSAPPGAIVRVWFPESEAVMQPGPKFRPCLVVECTQVDGHPIVLLAYGTSQHVERRGLGEMIVRRDQSKALEKDTKFCLQRLIRLPLTSAYFCCDGEQPAPEPLSTDSLRTLMRAMDEIGLI